MKASLHNVLHRLPTYGLNEKIQGLDPEQVHGITAFGRYIDNHNFHILQLFPYITAYFYSVCTNQFYIQKKQIRDFLCFQIVAQTFPAVPDIYIQIEPMFNSIFLYQAFQFPTGTFLIITDSYTIHVRSFVAKSETRISRYDTSDVSLLS